MFAQESPLEVLIATFAPLYQPATEVGFQGPPPELPHFEPPPDDDWWVPDWKEDAPERADPYVGEPWRHPWATHLSSSMSVSTVPTAALIWSELECWHFSCRCSFKAGPTTIFEALGWLGSFIQTSDNPYYPRPDLIGVMTFDNALRPYLLWCQHGQITMENLNGPDDEF